MNVEAHNNILDALLGQSQTYSFRQMDSGQIPYSPTDARRSWTGSDVWTVVSTGTNPPDSVALTLQQTIPFSQASSNRDVYYVATFVDVGGSDFLLGVVDVQNNGPVSVGVNEQFEFRGSDQGASTTISYDAGSDTANADLHGLTKLLSDSTSQVGSQPYGYDTLIWRPVDDTGTVQASNEIITDLTATTPSNPTLDYSGGDLTASGTLNFTNMGNYNFDKVRVYLEKNGNEDVFGEATVTDSSGNPLGNVSGIDVDVTSLSISI